MTAPGVPQAASRVSRSAAAAISAAWGAVDRLDVVAHGGDRALGERHQPARAHPDRAAGRRHPLGRAGQRAGPEVEFPLVRAEFAVADVEFTDLPAGSLSFDQELERVAEGPVGDAEVQQRPAVRRPQRRDVPYRQATAAQQEREHDVASPGMPWPDAGAGRHPASYREVGAAAYCFHQHRQFGQVEGAVRVREAHDVRGRGFEACVHGGAIAAAGFVDHLGAECGGNVRRAVARTVVHDDGAVAGRQRA